MEASLPIAETRAMEPFDIARIFAQHAGFVRRLAQRLVGSAALADDVTQEVFLLAHRRRGELTEADGIRTWFYRATVNIVRQGFRADRRYRAALARWEAQPQRTSGTSAEGHLDRKENGMRIRACIARLSPEHREVFVLYELEQLDGAAIAAILGIPLNTVWSRLRLAREAFRKLWSGLDEENP